jgi:serine/threonine-protein kinase
MAMVWAARVRGTRGFQKIVAVKTMLSKLSEDAQFEQMFLDEASLASQIRHPNVVEISDLGEQDGVLYLAMEWIDGVPLNQLMKAAKPAGGVPLAVAVRIVMNAAAGLHAAHELRDGKGQLIGLVHRDVSPQNILVTYDGVSKVVDFGVAKATAMGGGATMVGQLKGKVGYMAPEQVRGEAIDRRVDIFALGIVLYALTTGKHPFRRENEAATMYTIASNDVVVSPRKFSPGYPASLETVLLKALAKDPAERYSTASEFLRALDQCLPASEKANTDEDVGVFIGKLFGKKREESRAALAEALALADRQGPGMVGSTTGTGRHSAFTQSQVSSLSTVGVAQSLVPEGTFSSVGAPERAVQQRRKRLLLISISSAVLVACVAALASHMGGNNAAERAAPAAQLSVPAKPNAAAPAETTEHNPPKVELQALPMESATPNAPTTPAPVRALGGAPRASTPAAPPASAKSASPAKPAAPKWRQDPGF